MLTPDGRLLKADACPLPAEGWRRTPVTCPCAFAAKSPEWGLR